MPTENKLVVALVMFIVAGSFGWTSLVRSEAQRVHSNQQQQLDALLEIQQADAARVCMSLPTQDERLDCLNKVYPPAEKGDDE